MGSMKKMRLRITQGCVLLKYILIKPLSYFFQKKYKDVWLISEMGNEARDNGAEFFKYMTREHPEVDSRFVISKRSRDYDKIVKMGKAVKYRSIKHFLLYMTAGVLISSHIMGYAPEYRSFHKIHKKNNFFAGRGKKVFLQHGITKDYVDSITAEKVDLDAFICGAKPEYDYIKQTYGFNRGVVRYTGFARYDRLSCGEQDDAMEAEEDFILFMPTWRSDLFYIKNEKEFTKTKYFKSIKQIITDRKLMNVLNDRKVRLILYPHQGVQQYLKAFEGINLPPLITIADQNKYDISALLRKCKMLVTDYSSVFFDIAYLEKPIVYIQGDYTEYRECHYREGYFDYKKNGFGPITKDSAECVSEMIRYIDSGYLVEQKYRYRTKRFFTYRDPKNCERIFEVINSLGCKK